MKMTSVNRYAILLTILSIQMILVAANTRLPLVGIVSVPVFEKENSFDYTQATVGATYVRWLEASGADSVVINPWATDAEIDDILTKVNGVLIQGGSTTLSKENPYIMRVQTILEKSIKIADTQGKTIPIFAICQGFQILHYIVGKEENLFGNFKSLNTATSLIFDSLRIKTTRLFTNFNNNDIVNVATQPVVFENHSLGIEPMIYQNSQNLRKFFRITSLSKDNKNYRYVASVEAYNYPIYATQFHPELIAFNRSSDLNVPNSIEAISIARAFGNFFVQETKVGNQNVMKAEDYAKYNWFDPYNNYPTLSKEGSYQYIFTKS